MEQKSLSSQNKPLSVLILGLIALCASFFLFKVFQSEPDSKFPSGRFPAYCLCYILTIIGSGYLYSYAINRRWLAGSRFANCLIVALGLTLFAAIPTSLVFGSHHASVKIYVAGFALKTTDAFGRLILLPIVAIFAFFVLLAWWEVMRQFFSTRKK